eukprot:TRINITY_DN12241_c1_g1_i1.p1 TRINITY_DN12241_c1_g1~~TRINITY_DN12241_c1_g1_i1.p1  ORF type:complete len:680 (+),score=117.55 TRINITY_DN12241_c1_g1_i1:956-2995(+)
MLGEMSEPGVSPEPADREVDELKSLREQSPDDRATTPAPRLRPKETSRKRVQSPVPSVTARRKPPPDQRGSVFKSGTQRFRAGDILAQGGISLISGSHQEEEGPSRQASGSVPRKGQRSPQRTHGYSVHTSGVRKRYVKPTRWKVDEWSQRPECVGRTACDATCMTVADSTVWCAERDGSITIREKDGCVFAIVERDASAPDITSMMYVSSTLKGGRILVGHANGTLLSLDASTAERCSPDVSMHNSDVTCITLVYQSPTSSLAISASSDGTVCTFDVHTLQACSSPLVHPAAVRCVVSSGPYSYTGCDDGCVRKWDSQTGIESSIHGVGGPVTDLVLAGRYIWTCVSGSSQLAIIDTVTLLEVTAPQSPTPATAVKVVMVGQSCWVAHEDGTIAVWNVQTLELERVTQSTSPAQVVSACKVVTVPEDYEVWSLTEDGEVNMWRNYEYTLPLWCSNAYTTWGEELGEVREKVSQLRAAHKAKCDEHSQLEGLYERLKEDMIEQSQLQQSVQNLVDVRAHEVDVESERRKRVEVELSELRQCIISAHKARALPQQHLLHYKPSDVKAVVNWLAFESNSTQRAREPGSELHNAISDADAVLRPDMEPLSSYSELEMVDVVRRLTDATQGEGTARVAESEALRVRNAALEEDNARLKDMLEKLKASHRRVNNQLQALSSHGE